MDFSVSSGATPQYPNLTLDKNRPKQVYCQARSIWTQSSVFMFCHYNMLSNIHDAEHDLAL